jgi:phage-related minor tail protein
MDERIDIEVVDKVAKSIKPELLGISAAAKNAYTQIAKLKRELGVTGGSGMGATMKAVASAERDATRASRERASQASATARALDKEAAAAAKLAAKYQQQARAASSQSAYNKSAGIGRSTKSAADSYKAFDDHGLIDKTSASLDNMGKKAELGRHHLLNLGFQLQDLFVSLQAGQNPLTVFIQQGGQIGQIAAQSGVGIGGMAKAIGGVLAKAVFSATAGLVALGAGAVAVGYAFISGSQDSARLSNSLSISTNKANLTTQSLYKLSDSIADSTNKSVSSVREIASAYAIDGRYSLKAVTDLTIATQKFADLTGKSASDVVSEWSKMAEGPTDFAYKLAESYDLLTLKQIEQIRKLEEQGQASQATEVLVSSLKSKLEQQTVNLGYLEQAWRGVTNAISDAWTALKNWGAEANTARPWTQVVNDLERERAKLKGTTVGDQDYVGRRLKQLDGEIGKAKQWAAIEEKRRKTSAETAKVQREGIAASAAVTAQTARFADDSERAARAVKEYKDNIEKIKRAGGTVPTDKQQAQTIAGIEKQYTPYTNSHKPKKLKESEAEKLAKRQQKALREINADLAREADILAQGNVGIDATIAERMNSIADSLDNVKISLKDANGNWTEYGKKVLVAVTANEEAKRSLATFASIYDAAVKPAGDWAIAQEQAAKAIEKWGAEADKADLINKWLAEQKEDYLNATNPMLAYNKSMRDQSTLLKYYGKELEIQTEIQRRYNDMVAANPALKDTLDKNSLRGEVAKDRNANDNQSFLSDLEQSGLQNSGQNVGGNNWLLDNYKNLYAQIDAMRKGDVESERNAQAAKRELDRRYLDARLEGTRTTLDALSSLQDSKTKEFAAIGKAAAVAQATIDGILAVQKALATLPPPVNFVAAAAIGVATAANVAKITGIGFQKGGYTGDMPAHAAVGAVHGREYVMDANATARIGVPALDALRSGRLNPGPANDNRGAKVTVINNANAEIVVRERSDGELEIMVDRRLEAKFGETMQRHMSQPNSKASQAVGSNFKVRRNR